MDYQVLANTLKIVADSNRLEILDILSCGERCGCDLLAHFSFSQPTLSHHMKVLKAHQLVTCQKVGTKMMYRLNDNKMQELINQLQMIHRNSQPCVCDALPKGVCE
ncbi:ArsR/SmtB family transcription factor [Staphylococcus felis]|uniref:ArsR/SmtB family transcription factor n=1 Tax=Staphylococcus felis TaxID=46127 RepID=UPI000E2886E8|nr:metalloregulator ArsR/SmtB family transcription factor [Staphylococcus felis]REH81745.1 transcriptional regulator [Staphylococcus felis]REH89041.1 transcriptional regulator [Staphylococcus felis]REI09752.1 transcriptional regulator [Staphylococcus felis]